MVLGAVLLGRMSHQAGENLEPRVDALEYATLAIRLSAGEAPMLPIGSHTYPSRYPIGFPLLLAPAAWAGVPPERLYEVSAVFALVGIAATAVAARRIAGSGLAVWAALLLALSPLYLRHGGMVMSDGPAAVIAAVWAAVLLRRGPSLALGLLAGFACSIRLMNVPLLLGGSIAALWIGDCRARARYVVGSMVGLLPVAVSVAAGWSRPLGGYAFWMPEFYDPPTAAFGMQWLRANLEAYGAALLGAQWRAALYPIVVVPLAALGVCTATTDRRRVAVVAGTALGYAALCLGYFFTAERLLLPVVPLLLIAAASGLATVARRRPGLAVAIVTLTLVVQGATALRATRPAERRASSPDLMAAVEGHLPASVLVVSDVPAVLAWLYWVRGTSREFLPLVVPPRGRKRNVDDRHLRRLYANAREPQWPGTVPETFVDARGASPSGLDVVRHHAERGSPAIVVTCTGYGRRALAAAHVALTPLAVEGPCALSTLAEPTLAAR